MIYLFEDREGRMNQYFDDIFNSEAIKSALIDCPKKDLLEYLNQNFSYSKAILFHKSYSFSDNNITNEDVKKYFLVKRIPFVYFSGSLNNNLVIENGIINGNVNSGDMYNNLKHFLEVFNNQSKVNIPLLIYGKKYLLNSLLELQNMIGIYLFNTPKEQKLSLLNYNEIIDIVDARLKEDELKEDKAKLLTWLYTEKVNQSIVKQTLLSQIQKLIDKY